MAGIRYGLKILQQCGKKLKLKVRNFQDYVLRLEKLQALRECFLTYPHPSTPILNKIKHKNLRKKICFYVQLLLIMCTLKVNIDPTYDVFVTISGSSRISERAYFR